MSYRSIILLVVSVLNLVYQQGWIGGGASPFSPVPTAAVYIFEKDATPPPSSVRAGINRVNRETSVRATEFEDDATDGDGDVPAQYEVPLKAAREVGLPAFVVMAGDVVSKVTPKPTTEQQIVEAVK
jgi:hypothetical protein